MDYQGKATLSWRIADEDAAFGTTRPPSPPVSVLPQAFHPLCNTPATRVCPSRRGERIGRTVRGCPQHMSKEDHGPAKTGGYRSGYMDGPAGPDRGRARAFRPDRRESLRPLRGRGRHAPGGVRPAPNGPRDLAAQGLSGPGSRWCAAGPGPAFCRSCPAARRGFSTMRSRGSSARCRARGVFRRVFPHHLLRRRPRLRFRRLPPMPRFAPGARVLAAGPVATLDPARAPFERRFRSRPAPAFPGSRLGFGPAGLATAGRALVLYDPTEIAPAAHAALHTGPNVTRLGLPHAGRDFSRILQEAEASIPVLRLLDARRGQPPPRCARHSRTPAAGTPARWCGGRARR